MPKTIQPSYSFFSQPPFGMLQLRLLRYDQLLQDGKFMTSSDDLTTNPKEDLETSKDDAFIDSWISYYYILLLNSYKCPGKNEETIIFMKNPHTPPSVLVCLILHLLAFESLFPQLLLHLFRFHRLGPSDPMDMSSHLYQTFETCWTGSDVATFGMVQIVQTHKSKTCV